MALGTQLQVWIPGNPASFATSAEKEWKEQLRTHLIQSKDFSSFIEMSFTLSEKSTAHMGHDLDNLSEPVFSVLVSDLGWFGGRRTNVDGWRATKIIGSNTGLQLRQGHSLESEIPFGALLFDECYFGKLPRNATNQEVPNWLTGFQWKVKPPKRIGLSLTFINTGSSIASISNGTVKPMIDCLYPLYGGSESKPHDYLITDLTVKRIVSPYEEKHVRVVVWDCERAKTTRSAFSEGIKHLIDELYIINEYFDAYVALYNKQALDVDILNYTPGFFQLTLHAFLHQFAVMLCRMYEDNDRNSPNSLPSLVRSLEEHGRYVCVTEEAYKDTVAYCKTLLQNHSENLIKLKTLRDKTLVHNDNEWIRKDIWREHSPTIGEYRAMVEAAHEILCRMGNLIDIPTPILGMGIESDIDRLIALLKQSGDVESKPLA